MLPRRRASILLAAISVAVALAGCVALPPASGVELEAATVTGSFYHPGTSNGGEFGPFDVSDDALQDLGEALSQAPQDPYEAPCGAGMLFTVEWRTTSGDSDSLEIDSCGAQGRDGAVSEWLRDYLQE